MNFFLKYRFVICFLVSLVFCNVMVRWQYLHNESSHLELREDLLRLEAEGQLPRAQFNYEKLVSDLPRLANRTLLDDLHRTAIAASDSESLAWKYYWTVRNELRKRSVRGLFETVDLVKNVNHPR
jgi:hypothetical protein